ncbi:MAG TPA: hypothetical protein VGE77_02830 [Nocardioides sp.]
MVGSCLSLQVGAALAMSLFPAAGSWGTTTVRLAIAAVMSHRLRELAWVGLALVGMGLFLVADLTGHGSLDALGVVLALAAGPAAVARAVPGSSWP